MAIPYTPLLYHSNYGVGGSNFKVLFEYLSKYKIKSCGIVDETFFGLLEFIKYAKTYNIKPVIGAQIPLPPQGNIKLYLFVKDQQGYENLCQILTAQAFKNINLKFIKEHSLGLVLLSNSVKLINELDSAFAESYYLLLPFHTALGKEIPLLAAHEIFYVTKREKILYKLMCAVKGHRYEYKKGIPKHLLTPREFSTIFSDYPKAIMNNQRLSEICNFIPGRRRWIFPESTQNLCEIITLKSKNLTQAEKSRIQYEYQIIEQTGFKPYFSLVYHLKEFALSKGIGMNVRGSAASSFILYLLGLSVVDPLKYNLPFERFLNPQRTEPPDIDVDVEFSQRQRLIQEIYKKFGSDYVAHICVINRFQRRARFRDTARAYGISPQELKNIKNHCGERLIKNLYTVSEQIDNYPHYFSCHASGIVITPKPIYKFVPLYPSPAGQITHYDKDGTEMVGLVKIDILGVRGFPGLYLSKEKINFKDPKVYTFIGEGKTLGCFQIESPMVRQFLKRIKPKTLIDIANAIAVIRPGPSQGGMKEKFLKRLKGEEKIYYPHSRLKRALSQTLGIPIYQEQILQIAHDFARFSLSDGDMLRRAMTKERNSNRMKELEELFFNKAQKVGYNKKEIETVWSRIRAFSSFGFNKAHSITYATLAYLSAYQKFYNSLEFFCRIINNKGGYYPTYAYINEARRWGLKILAPDVNKSGVHFSIYKGALMTGLSEIKNLSSPTMRQIMKLQPFTCAEDFFFYIKVPMDEGVSLIKSGGLDTFRHTWPELYFILLNSKQGNLGRPFTKRRGVVAPSPNSPNVVAPFSNSPNVVAPFSNSPNVVAPFMVHDIFRNKILTEKLPELHDFDSGTKLHSQLNTIGFLPEKHILEIFYPSRPIKIADLVVGKHSTITGTLIARRIILTKNNKLMSFLTIDDETETLEVVIFPDRHKTHSVGPILQINGVIKDDSLIADHYTPLSVINKTEDL